VTPLEPRPMQAWFLGKNTGIMVDLATGVFRAGAGPRLEAYALAW
jgi:hypothetical protein